MIKSCVILSAGLGTRMRPLTNHIPKPMIEIGNKPIISHIIDMVLGTGCNNIVVNIHYKPDVIRNYINDRYAGKVIFSDETGMLLDSGGGVAKAISKIKNNIFFVINADCIWCNDDSSALQQVITSYDPDKMDILKLLYPSENAIGFEEDNIYDIKNGIIVPGSNYSFTGIQVLKKSLFESYPIEPFSIREIWKKSFDNGKVYGHVFEGNWLHIGTPDAVEDANSFFRSN